MNMHRDAIIRALNRIEKKNKDAAQKLGATLRNRDFQDSDLRKESNAILHND